MDKSPLFKQEQTKEEEVDNEVEKKMDSEEKILDADATKPVEEKYDPNKKTVLAKIVNLKKSFKIRNQIINVLKGIDLEIYDGELVLLLGPSGSGKSTLVNTLMGLDDTTSGEIFFCGVPIHSSTEDELAEFRKQNIGIVYQQSIWIKSMDVISNVAFPLTLRGMPKHKAFNQALETLQSVGMDKWAAYSPLELSSGQQQKIALARALITDPKIVIADEPTGNLDYKSGIELTEMLLKLTVRGRTVLMITHDLENVQFAKRIIRMFDGEIAEIIDRTENSSQDIREELIKKTATPDSTVKEDIKKIENGETREDLTIEELVTDRLYDSKKEENKNVMIGDLSSKGSDAAISNYTTQEGVEVERLSIKQRLKLVAKGIVNSFRPKNIKKNLFSFVNVIQSTTVLFILILLSFGYRAIYGFLSLKVMPSWVESKKYGISNRFNQLNLFLGRNRGESITYSDLLTISIKNLLSKSTRSIITIGGIGIGIGFTVFLISIGFGLERLVVNRIANLDQLRQLDVFSISSNELQINDESLNEFTQFEQVEQVLPVVGIAGKVNYENSNTDVVIYGVQSDYLKKSDESLVSGEFYTNNDTAFSGDISEPVEVGEEQLAELEALGIGDERENVFLTYIPDNAVKEVVVNTAFLNILSIRESDAVGETISISFIATEEVISESIELQSFYTKYKIVGVITNGDNALMYVPIVDLKSMGIDLYSSARLVSDRQENVNVVRQQLEALGYRTTTILDTIEQVQSVFGTARSVFAVVGFVALAVAAFGMFNTLTVSLLERTKEVGLMKSIGMKSQEIKDLFLTESITMGLLGGFAGIIIGVLGGLIVSLILSLVAVSRGFEFINITYVPWLTVLQIMAISAFTGVVTGFYPALRATKISPIDALRYE